VASVVAGRASAIRRTSFQVAIQSGYSANRSELDPSARSVDHVDPDCLPATVCHASTEANM
jgi:hypothetical protein